MCIGLLSVSRELLQTLIRDKIWLILSIKDWIYDTKMISQKDGYFQPTFFDDVFPKNRRQKALLCSVHP